MGKTVKFRAGKYGYKGWIIEKVEGIWLMFPPGDLGATDAANSKSDAIHNIIEEQRDLERSRKSIQAVKEMMTVLNKQ